MSLRFFPILSFIFLSVAVAVAADEASLPFISPILGDNMVLQRGKENTIWGWSKPGDVVQVEIAGRSAPLERGRPSVRYVAKVDFGSCY